MGCLVAEGELGFEVGEGDAHLTAEDEKVEEEVASFVDEAGAVAVDGLYYGFCGFFPHFLRYCLNSLYEETCGVGIFGHFLFAFCHYLLQTANESF